MSENVKTKKPRSAGKKTTAKKNAPQEKEIVSSESLLADTVEATKPADVQTKAQPNEKNQNKQSRPVSYEDEDESQELFLSEEVPAAGFLNRRGSPYPTGSEGDNELKVKLSGPLYRKLTQQASEEGIALEELVRELLAESVVLRAWEIIERKNQMRGNANNPPNNNMNRNQQNHRGGHRNKGGHRGGMSQMRYQNIMDDKATFLEYVRNQERNRR